MAEKRPPGDIRVLGPGTVLLLDDVVKRNQGCKLNEGCSHDFRTDNPGPSGWPKVITRVFLAPKVGDHELKEAGQLEAEKGGKTDSPLEPPERKGTLMTLKRRQLRPCRLPTSRPADTVCQFVAIRN